MNQNNKYKILFLLLTIFLVMRIFILLFFIKYTYCHEERQLGAITNEIMEGASLPLLEYPLDSYSGGSLFSAFLTVPFFALFGKNIFALKLTPLLFSAATLAMLFLFSCRYFGFFIAGLAGLLFIFAPPVWIANTLINLGGHAENIFFTISAVFLFYEIIFQQKKYPVYYFALGFICGLGTYWIYTFLITLASILIIWFVHDRKAYLRKEFYIFWSGFLLWVIPWLSYNLSSNFVGVRWVFSPFYKQDFYNYEFWLERLALFVKNIWFSRMFNFANDNALFYVLFSNVYVLIFWLGLLYIFRTHKYSIKRTLLSKDSFLFIFPLLLIISASFYISDPGSDVPFLKYRYLVGLFPVTFLVISIFLSRVFLKYRFLKYSFFAVFFIFAVTGALRYSRYLSAKDFGIGFKKTGYSYRYLSVSFMYKYPDDLCRIMENITRLKPPQNHEVLSQLVVLEIAETRKPVDFLKCSSLSLRLEERFRPVFYKMLIRGMFHAQEFDITDLVKQVDRLSLYVDERYRPYLYEAVGSLVSGTFPEDLEKQRGCARIIEEKYRPYYYRGLGDWFLFFDLNSGWYKDVMKGLSEKERDFFAQGIGAALSQIGFHDIIDRPFTENRGKDPLYGFLDRFEPGYKQSLLEGVATQLSYFLSNNSEKDVGEFIDNLKNEKDQRCVREFLPD